MRRLTTYYEQAEAGVGPSGGEGPLCVTFDEPLPLVDFFEVRGSSHSCVVTHVWLVFLAA